MTSGRLPGAGGVHALPRPLLHKADFERLLQTPIRSRSTHFAVHHVAAGPSAPARRPARPEPAELSTGTPPVAPCPVDDLPPAGPLQGHWLGSVVPKRHARRAVTRNLIKRQIRAVVAARAGALPPGLWLVRLRAPFAPQAFPSAASAALRHAAREEIERLFRPLAHPQAPA